MAGSLEIPGEPRVVAVSGGYAYIAAGTGGLQVIDIAMPASPQYVGLFDTPGDALGVVVSSYHVFVADGDGGLRVAQHDRCSKKEL